MALYLIGDLQGCDRAFASLLEKIGFSPSRDRLIVLGDLVNRGPDSLGVLRRLATLGDSAQCLLGNHDLHLLAVAHGVRRAHRSDTVDDILNAPDRDAWLDWLRTRSLALHERGILMVHAGVLPSWDVARTLGLAREVEAVISGPDLPAFLHQMYGNEPARWSESLRGADRLRVIVNALTRLRFCTADGTMEFDTKEGLDATPPGFMPWFDVAQRATRDVTVAFGHWSTVGLIDRPGLISLDTGCVWGRQLSAMRIGRGAAERELIQVDCSCVR